MARDRQTNARVLEQGDIFFFYRPDVDQEAPSSLLDVRRFFVALRPRGEDRVRLIAVGRKKLPESGQPGQNHWGFVARVFEDPEALRNDLDASTYETETQGERHLPGARPVGEGIYALARQGRNTVLAYVLELPETPGEVQEAFNIQPEGQFVVSIKNPEAASPPGIGLDDDRQADFPEELRERFGDRKWIPADPPAFLDCEGAELVLIGGRAELDAEELDLEPDPEDEQTAEVFQDLRLEKSQRTVRPLIEGVWS